MTGIALEIAKSWDTGQNLTSALCNLAVGGMADICRPEHQGKPVSEILDSLEPDVLVSIYSISTIRLNIQNSLKTLNELLMNSSANSVLVTGHDLGASNSLSTRAEHSDETKPKCNENCVQPHILNQEIRKKAPTQHLKKVDKYERVNTNGIKKHQITEIQIIKDTYTSEVETQINPLMEDTKAKHSGGIHAKDHQDQCCKCIPK